MRTATAVAVALAVFGPSAQNNALPEQERFLREARRALERSQGLWHRYMYKERRTDVHVNPFGRMGTGDTRVIAVFPSPNPRLWYRKVIERNGVPVRKHELDRQDAEYRARVQQAERSTGRREADGGERAEQTDQLARLRAQRVIADVLDTMRFEIVRREVWEGAPAVVVAFSARPDARPATRQGRIAKVFKGSAWVHEASREVIRVEAVAVDDVSFGGFIAKLYEGTRAAVKRQEIEPGVWMPTQMKLTGDVRALFRKATINYLVEWYDYDRIDDDASVPPHAGIEQ